MVNRSVKKKLVTRAEFARLTGVSPSAVTKACKNQLKEACTGKKIDIHHEKSIKYINFKDASKNNPIASGVDERYEEAVNHCKTTGKYSIRGLQKDLSISYRRADKIIKVMSAAGLIPESEKISSKKPKTEKHSNPKPKIINGHTKKNETKKSESLNSLDQKKKYNEIPKEIEEFADMTLREIIRLFGSEYAFVDWLKASKLIEEVEEKRIKNAESKGKLVSRDLIKKGIIEPIDTCHINLLTDGARTMSIRVPALHESGKTPSEIEEWITEKMTTFIRPVKDKVKKVLKNVCTE
jgi:hypothetical protein